MERQATLKNDAPSGAGRSTPRVLIVEDDQDIRETLAQVLELEGYEVHTAGNGRIALDWVNSQTDLPCVILLDLFMPEMDGREFLQNFKASKKFSGQNPDPRLSRPAVVVLTAAPPESEIVKTVSQQSYKFLKKPIDLEELLAVVATICQKLRGA